MRRSRLLPELTLRRLLLLWALVMIVMILWLVGLRFDTGGGLLQLLLIAALVALLLNLVTGRWRVL